MAVADGNYLIVVAVKNQPITTITDLHLSHAKDDAHSRAKALEAVNVDFHICVVDATDMNLHYLDIFTRNGRMNGVGPVRTTQ